MDCKKSSASITGAMNFTMTTYSRRRPKDTPPRVTSS